MLRVPPGMVKIVYHEFVENSAEFAAPVAAVAARSEEGEE